MSAMAERVQRLTREAFHRLRNDHEQFLDAYEKPTQIYRFLKARQALKPLFLHRNLSYMPKHHKGRRRFRKKLRVDELLEHTQDIRPDLATEIKSDNHMKISFSGIEQGFRFQGLLAGREETAERKQASCKEGAPEHGQLMEVELLLLKFKQSSVQLSEGSHPYSCSSLGKRFLKYKAVSTSSDHSSTSSNTNATTGGNNTIGKDDHLNFSGGGQDLTLTIPESVLAWKGDCGPPGTQMLVFRVSYVTRGPASKPKRKPLQLINFVSRKGCRKNVKNVAVEVNRLNLAEIGQNRNKARQQLSAGEVTGLGSVTSNRDVSSDGAGRGGSGLEIKDEEEEEEEGGEFSRLGAGMEVGGAEDAQRQEEGHADARDKQATPPLDVVSEGGGKGKSSLSKHGLLQRKSRTKLKKSKTDASVMTELSYGTDDIPDLYAVGNHTPLTPPLNNYIAKGNHSNTYPSPTKDHTQSPPLPKVGFVHKCTSPGHPFRNGTLNGMLNGYALPEVAAALKGRSEPHPPNKTNNNDDEELFSVDKDGGYSSLLKGGGQHDGLLKTLTKRNRKRRGRTKMLLQQSKSHLATSFAGSGKRGTRSFLVSIPRSHYTSRHRPPDSPRGDGTKISAESAATPPVVGNGEDVRGGKQVTTPMSTPHKRRSEIQLLFDGDKPPGQRLSKLEIPVFVAEDISHRSVTSTSTGSNAIWLGSSTRRITPTDHFSYPLHFPSPTKRGSLQTSSVVGSTVDCNGLTSNLSPGHGAHRKRRTSGNMDATNSVLTSPDSLPPSKQPKVVSPDPLPPGKQPKVASIESSDFDPQLVSSSKKPLGKPPDSDAAKSDEKGEDCLPDPNSAAAEPLLEAETGKKLSHLTNGLMMLSSFPPRVGAVVGKEEGTVEKEKGEGERGREGSEESSTAVSQGSTSFSAELVVFDSRGECLVRDGEYSILMQCTSKKKGTGLSTFEPLTWKTVFGRGEQNKNGCTGEAEESLKLLLNFSVSWLQGPPQHRLCNQLSTALDFKKIREAYICPPSPPSTIPSPSLLAPPTNHASLFDLHPNGLSAGQELPGPQLEREEPFRSVKMSAGGGGEDGHQDLTGLDHQHRHAPSLLPVSSSSSSSLDDNADSARLPSKVSFNFLYSNNTLQQTESRQNLNCPWCSLSCGKIYSLLKHMAMCHPRFHFTYTPNSEDGKSVVNVHVNKLYNTGSASFDRDPGERSNVGLVQRRGGPSKCLSCSAVLVERHADVKEDLSEFLNDGSWKRGYNTNRIYYHSRSCLPMLPKEIEAESEEELQTLEWQNICSQKMIDEFTDVNQGEKDLMKLWNVFALENKVIADKQIPVACLRFAQQKRQLLHERGLVPNFMSHMVNLFDFGLLPPAVLKKGMQVILGLEEEEVQLGMS